eukprot:Phypoly_transcript_11727.p1 GENE.Phypoly_transcript_11727~~Phypoly_transcript_11727.p1  ORF type:complete len:368 (+),score=54.49 Phypoly_transcript_11727:42-1106(+)
MEPKITLPFESEAAWHRKDYQNNEKWIHKVSSEDVEELEEALKVWKSSGVDFAAITKATFPLKNLGEKLLQHQKDIVWGRGFLLVRGLNLDKYTKEEIAAIFLGIGAYFGEPVSQNGLGHILGHVKDLGNDPSNPLTRLYTTNAKHRFHTDSCDIVGLLCLRPAMEGGLSSISSSTTVYNEILQKRPDLLEELVKPLCWDRKGEIPEGKKGYWMQPVFDFAGGLVSCIYDRSYFTYRFEEIGPLTAHQTEALDFFEAVAASDELRLDMELQRGDMQFLHNHTILHSRTAYVDHEDPEFRRHLLRLWLSAPNGRPLPSVYAERFGEIEVGKKRGGIIVPGIKLCAPLEAGVPVKH